MTPVSRNAKAAIPLNYSVSPLTMSFPGIAGTGFEKLSGKYPNSIDPVQAVTTPLSGEMKEFVMMNDKGWFMGADHATVGETVTLSVSGFSKCVRAVFSASNARLSSTNVSVSGGAARVSARMMTAGSARITARGYDDNDMVAQEATHTIQVSPRDETAPGSSDKDLEGWDGGENDLQFLCTNPCVGRTWHLRFKNVGAGESLVVEFQGSNGGIFRLFPRGRNEMTTQLTPKAPGKMSVHITMRDTRLNTVKTGAFNVDVLPAGDQPDAGRERFSQALAEAAPSAPALDPEKPPYLLPHDTFAGEEVLQAEPTVREPSSALSTSLGSPTDIMKDMQARTDALLNRLKKR